MSDIKFEDLTGDYVYDYLKTFMIPGNELLGGIINNKICVRPTEARKTISLYIKTKNEGNRIVTYNYNKLSKKAEMYKWDMMAKAVGE